MSKIEKKHIPPVTNSISAETLNSSFDILRVAINDVADQVESFGGDNTDLVKTVGNLQSSVATLADSVSGIQDDINNLQNTLNAINASLAPTRMLSEDQLKDVHELFNAGINDSVSRSWEALDDSNKALTLAEKNVGVIDEVRGLTIANDTNIKKNDTNIKKKTQWVEVFDGGLNGNTTTDPEAITLNRVVNQGEVLAIEWSMWNGSYARKISYITPGTGTSYTSWGNSVMSMSLSRGSNSSFTIFGCSASLQGTSSNKLQFDNFSTVSFGTSQDWSTIYVFKVWVVE